MRKRAEEILKKTIENYIETAVPVGSEALKRANQIECSSATVRQALNELEKTGYLKQLHTSSGRVPTDKGYRHYVEMVKTDGNKITQSKLALSKVLDLREGVDDMLTKTSAFISSCMNYTVISKAPQRIKDTIKAAHFILLDIKKVLVVLISSVGINHEFLCNIDANLDQDTLGRISNILNQSLNGMDKYEVSESMMTQMIEKLPLYKSVLEKMTKEINQFLKTIETQSEVDCFGQSQLLKHPEFEDVQLIRQVFDLLEDTTALSQLFDGINIKGACQVLIGEECEHSALKECSLVMLPYRAPGTTSGKVGILGPKRMQYNTLIPMANIINSQVQETVKEAIL